MKILREWAVDKLNFKIPNKLSNINFMGVNHSGTLLGYVSFHTSDGFFMGNIALHGSGDKLWLVWPEKRLKYGRVESISHPLSRSKSTEILNNIKLHLEHTGVLNVNGKVNGNGSRNGIHNFRT